MNSKDFVDRPPESGFITAYDRAHFILYLSLLDADALGVSWQVVVAELFGLNPMTDPGRAARVHAAHLARAMWMTRIGYRELAGLPPR
jgi:hypothetical protein